MEFKEALKLMKNGEKVKPPAWGGCWFWDEEKETIMMHTKDDAVMDIRETQRVDYTLSNILSDEWVIATSDNTPILGGEATFSFGEAIKYLKRGMKVKRKGWNGKDQHIELAKEISYLRPDGWVVGSVHEDTGSQAVVFVDTRGSQIGWTASQSDMLADDWVFAE